MNDSAPVSVEEIEARTEESSKKSSKKVKEEEVVLVALVALEALEVFLLSETTLSLRIWDWVVSEMGLLIFRASQVVVQLADRESDYRNQ